MPELWQIFFLVGFIFVEGSIIGTGIAYYCVGGDRGVQYV